MNSTNSKQVEDRSAFLKAEKAAHDADYSARSAIGRAKAIAKIQSLEKIQSERNEK